MHTNRTKLAIFLSLSMSSLAFWGCGQAEYEDEVNEQALIDMYSNLELSEGDYYVLETEGLPGK